MPTPIPGGEKTCALNKIKAYGCDKLAIVTAQMVNYEDLPGLFFAFQVKFEYDPVFLASLAACFTQGSLNTVGIYYNITGTNVDNPLVVINSTYQTVTYDTIPDNGSTVIIGTSNIDTLIVDVNLNILSISGGAKVRVLETGAGACIRTLRIVGQGNFISYLQLITGGSCIYSIQPTGIGVYGGMNCGDHSTPCASPVSLLAMIEITKHTATASWSNPVDTIGTIVQYRQKGESAWLNFGQQDDGITGNLQASQNKFSIRGLKEDTYYEVQAINICATGMQSSALQTSFLTTECCNPVIIGSNGTSLSFIMLASPDPGAGDGTPQNPYQLPVGNTITIPQVVGKSILWPVYLNNGPVQNFMYDPVTGTFDNTANGGFVENDLFTVIFN